MLIIRSLAFNVAFYVSLIVQMIFWSAATISCRRATRAWFVPKFWSRTSLWLMDKIAGTKSEITGVENLPEGSFILAPKHQSFWDAIAFFPYPARPALHPEARAAVDPVLRLVHHEDADDPGRSRQAAPKALKRWSPTTKREMAHDRQLIIYPEGTRRAPGDEPAYKYGIVELYAQLGLPVVPVAHVAGLWWPRRKFLRYPGTIKARFLPPIPAGLDKRGIHAAADLRDGGRLRRIAGRSRAGRQSAALAADGGEAAEGAGGGDHRVGDLTLNGHRI